MATPASAEANVPNAAPAKSGPGLVPILIAVVLSTLIALGSVAGGVFWLIRSGKLNGGASVAPAAPAARAEAPTSALAVIPSHVIALDPLVVNLADEGGKSYFRAGISLRLRDEEKVEKKEEAPKDPKAVDGVAVALRDTTLSVLSSETADALLAQEGRESLKKKLEEQYKLRNPDARVLDIYFTEFLVQR